MSSSDRPSLDPPAMATHALKQFAPPGDPPPMPARLPLARKGGTPRKEITLYIETTTPVFGGMAHLPSKTLEAVEHIRVPTIRGQLRFWWRALQRDPSLLRDPSKLSEKEGMIWGRSAGVHGGRSEVEIQVEVIKPPVSDSSQLLDGSLEAYALFPAIMKHGSNLARARPGIQARVTLVFPSEPKTEIEIRRAIRAWVLFGGYGGRVRRGVGSIKVVPPVVNVGTRASQRDSRTSDRPSGPSVAIWMPELEEVGDLKDCTDLAAELQRLLGDDVLKAIDGISGPLPFPLLAGATLFVGMPTRNAVNAWQTAVGWLRRYRKDRGLDRAVRDLDRSGWHDAQAMRSRLTRMPSQLITKALPLCGGQFLPCALWLSRGQPTIEPTGSRSSVGSASDVSGLSSFAGIWPSKTADRNPFFNALIDRKEPLNSQAIRIAP
jgi:CRISPR type III-B/RAMP module RAMP protein Cmr1